MAENGGSLSRLMEVGRRADPDFHRRLGRLGVLSLISAAVEIATLGAVLPLLTAVAAGHSGSSALPFPSVRDPLQLVFLFAAFVLAAALTRLMLTAAIQRGVLRVGHRINVAIQERLLAQPYLFHASTNSSRFVAALNKTDQLTLGVLGPLLQGLAGLGIGLAIITFLLVTIDWRVTVTAVAILGGAYLLLSRMAAGRLLARGNVIVDAYEDQVRLLLESSGAIRDILLDHRQAAFAKVFEQASARMAEARTGTDFLSQAPRFLVEALGAIAIAALAVLVAMRDGNVALSLPMFGLLALAMIRIVPLAQTAYRGWTMLAANGRAIDDVAELLRLPAGRPIEQGTEALPLQQAIDAADLDFGYPNSSTRVLGGVTFSLKRGEWLGISGPTGEGKSTIGDLVMGLLEPDSGHIAIDGQVLTSNLIPRWQRSVAHVSQSVYLLDGSIAANIALSLKETEIDRERVVHCARLAQLERWIGSLPDGIDASVGEQGRRISGGQRQRIGIARALYKGAPVLLFDEATSALDATTEAEVLDAIRRARPDVTMLMISHRVAALERCDRVLKLEGGRLAPA